MLLTLTKYINFKRSLSYAKLGKTNNFVRDYVSKGTINVSYINSKEKLIHILTKLILGELHKIMKSHEHCQL